MLDLLQYRYEVIAAGVLVVVLLYLSSRPRHYYFIRHGETVLNKQGIEQGIEGSLSEEGKVQAEQVGIALKPRHIRLICASPFTRTRETAEIIAKQVGSPRIRYTPLLAERRNPSEIVGKKRNDPAVAHIIDSMDLAFHADDYRYSDEENFLELRARARECLQYLEAQASYSVCVITHHAMLKMLLAYMLYQDKVHSSDFVKLSFYNQADNGAISACTYSPWSGTWSIEGYNQLSAS